MTLPAVPRRVVVSTADDVAVARRVATTLALESGLDRGRTDAVRVVATELAENLHRHAHGGELVVVPPRPGRFGAERLSLVALDRGPGVEHFERCLVDGFSSRGTGGIGLGGARRMSDAFDAVSEPGAGTIVRAGYDVTPSRRSGFTIGCFGLPIGTETVNGDDWCAVQRGSRLLVVVADGLGHGPLAAHASGAAVTEFERLTHEPPEAIVSGIGRGLTSSRGAAVTVASLEHDVAVGGGQVHSAGLGNVSVLVAGPDGSTRRIATSHGTAGSRTRANVVDRPCDFPPNGVLILHTDGLSSRWTLTGRAELLRHDADLVAAALWRDFARSGDDSMVAVVRAAPRALGEPS